MARHVVGEGLGRHRPERIRTPRHRPRGSLGCRLLQQVDGGFELGIGSVVSASGLDGFSGTAAAGVSSKARRWRRTRCRDVVDRHVICGIDGVEFVGLSSHPTGCDDLSPALIAVFTFPPLAANDVTGPLATGVDPVAGPAELDSPASSSTAASRPDPTVLVGLVAGPLLGANRRRSMSVPQTATASRSRSSSIPRPPRCPRWRRRLRSPWPHQCRV